MESILDIGGTHDHPTHPRARDGAVSTVSRSDRAARRYGARLATAMAAYVVVLLAAVLVLPLLTGPARYLVMATPIVPAAFVAVAVLRYSREADELQRLIVLESLAAAFALGSLITFGYGLLQVAGAPEVSWLFVWPVYAACWLLFALLARRRY